MKYKQTVITFRAFNMTHQETFLAKEHYSMVGAEFKINEVYGECAQVIKIKCGNIEYENPSYKGFKIETIRSQTLLKNKEK